MDAFHNQWLYHYPRPTEVIFNNGSEFKSIFKEMCENLGLHCKHTTSYNPQGNAVVEELIKSWVICLGLLNGKIAIWILLIPGESSSKLVHLVLEAHIIPLPKLPLVN